MQRLADIPKGYFSAILMVSFLGLVANLINWGFWACYIGDFCKRNCEKG
ncbi:TIGR00366 family protein [Campylobacter upsaliensis]|nr:TIGR00366 family protein [Campylobacter upsaliensis]MCR2098631.1 TIGR00366 family protein [Campylobacter upsaliensis]